MTNGTPSSARPDPDQDVIAARVAELPPADQEVVALIFGAYVAGNGREAMLVLDAWQAARWDEDGRCGVRAALLELASPRAL